MAARIRKSFVMKLVSSAVVDEYVKREFGAWAPEPCARVGALAASTVCVGSSRARRLRRLRRRRRCAAAATTRAHDVTAAGALAAGRHLATHRDDDVAPR